MAPSRLERLQKLKQKKAESSRLNKLDLYQDYKDQKLRTVDRGTIDKKKQEAERKYEELTAEEAGEDVDRKRNLQWTIKEWDEWDKKQKTKAKPGYNNFNQLAQQTYEKEIANLEVDKLKYKIQKDQLAKKHNGELSLTAIDFTAKTDETSKNQLVASIKLSDERKQTRRRRQGDAGAASYINDKNREFNLKLNRHYDEK